jgi:hypothetical protein
MPTGSSLPDAQLRLLARERIDDDTLPVAVSTRLLASYGRGHLCVLCAEAVTHEHAEYEVEDPRDGKMLTFHLRCY